MHSASRHRTTPPESESGMKQEQLTEILVLAKRIGNLLNEVEDLSGQLAEAIDRRDEVSMKMIVAMRYDPIEKLTLADRSLREQLNDLADEDDARCIRAILNGDGSSARSDSERVLAAQAMYNIRTHKKLLEQDTVLNRKIARDKSIYQ